MDSPTTINDQAELRSVYRAPTKTVLDKVHDHIDDGAAGFVASSPFMVLSTATNNRADASPRGGPPGFVRVLDRHRLAWGDLTGNNRLDSFENLIANPNVGLLFIVPGVLETLRVSGTAQLVRDDETLAKCVIDGRTPKTAVVVTVDECYIQCGAALRRGGVWDTDTWQADDERPSGAAILAGHLGGEFAADDIERGLADYYDNHIWAAGGRDDD